LHNSEKITRRNHKTFQVFNPQKIFPKATCFIGFLIAKKVKQEEVKKNKKEIRKIAPTKNKG
jgi:hypothetical protein